MDFVTPPGRRDIFGSQARRKTAIDKSRMRGKALKDDPLDKIVVLPEVLNAGYFDEEPWMADVTSRLAAEYDDVDAMPGRKPLGDIREERLSQALAIGTRQVDAFAYAGYRLTLPEVMTDRGVLHRIAYYRRLAIDACAVTCERIMSEISAIAFAQIGDAAEWDGDSVTLIPSKMLPAQAKRAIAEVKKGQFGVSLKHHNKMDGLKVLAQIRGMLKEKVEISGPDGKPIETAVTRDMDPRKAAEAYADLIKQGM